MPLHSPRNATSLDIEQRSTTSETDMQDANDRNNAREPHVPAAMLESVRELNHRFLDLVAFQSSDWDSARCVGLPIEVSEQIAPLTAAQKNAAANCPYVLFDLRFEDHAYWRARLHDAGRWSVEDAASGDENTQHFVSLALFFAWHVALTGKLAARLLLGMNEITACTFRGLTIDRLPALAASTGGALTARWSTCSSYWSALTVAATRPNTRDLRRIQLYGLQLAAAARLA